GDPLEDLWIQGTTPLSATASGSPTTGNAPLSVSFTGSATGGTAPYSYSWNFGDGSATSTAQNPSHTYNTARTYTATPTVTPRAPPRPRPLHARAPGRPPPRDPGQPGRRPPGGHGLRLADLRAGPVDRRLHRLGRRRNPALLLQLELRRRVRDQHGPEPRPHL